jgi:hypothetical protein
VTVGADKAGCAYGGAVVAGGVPGSWTAVPPGGSIPVLTANSLNVVTRLVATQIAAPRLGLWLVRRAASQARRAPPAKTPAATPVGISLRAHPSRDRFGLRPEGAGDAVGDPVVNVAFGGKSRDEQALWSSPRCDSERCALARGEVRWRLS